MSEEHESAFVEDVEESESEQRYRALQAENRDLLAIVKEQNRMLLLARDAEIELRVNLEKAKTAIPAPAHPQLTITQRILRLPITVPRRVYRRLKRTLSA